MTSNSLAGTMLADPMGQTDLLYHPHHPEVIAATRAFDAMMAQLRRAAEVAAMDAMMAEGGFDPEGAGRSGVSRGLGIDRPAPGHGAPLNASGPWGHRLPESDPMYDFFDPDTDADEEPMAPLDADRGVGFGPEDDYPPLSPLGAA